jgi:hypothetical protein
MTAMTMPLDCNEFAARLADYLDGDLPDAVRGAMNAHASGCAECGRLLSELETLRVDAGSLPLLEPSRDLWAGIAERIDARVLLLDASRSVRVSPMRRVWRHPAVAAAALVLITAGVTHAWTRYSYEAPAAAPATRQIAVAPPVVVEPSPVGTTTTEPSGTAPSAPAARRASRSGESTAPRSSGSRAAGQPVAQLVNRPMSASRLMSTEVEPVYDREIVKLRAIMRERRSQLDPKTVAVLEQSIAVIDSAIAQSRAALAKDPASGFLASQLNHSLETKVELLRTAALLPART